MSLHPPFRRILRATALPDWRLLVTFEGDERRVYDMRWILGLNGDLARALYDPDSFAQVQVEGGTVTWPNGFDVDPAWVYKESVPEESAAADS